MSTHHVGAEVDAEDGDGSKWEWNIGEDEHEEGRDFGNVGSQRVSDGFLQIIED